jgi:hypothetical protein
MSAEVVIVNRASRSAQRIQRYRFLLAVLLIVFVGAAVELHSQTCLSSPDMDPSIRSGLETAAKRYFDMTARGDTAGLKQNAIPSIAGSFAGVENAVKQNQANFSGASGTVRPPFFLNAEGTAPLERAEFLCGVFGPAGQTKDSAVFLLHNLPPGKYGLAIVDVTGGKQARTLTLVLEQLQGDWKLAGYYVTAPEAAGHDSAWFAQRARDFKAKSQTHNAWLYYRMAISLAVPVDFMSTLATDKLYEEIQNVQISDMPINGNAVDLNVVGKTVRWTEVFALGVGDDVDLVVKYSAQDISNTQKTYEQNVLVTKAVVAKFPELRDAFAGVVARAVDPSGQDYGSLMQMKEIK